MEYSKEDIRQAYIKLKSYVYYDNSDLLLRRQLVEFETGIGEEFLTNNPSSFYNIDSDIFSYKLHFTLDEKFERIAEELNLYNERKDFFDSVQSKVSIDFYPKKYKETPASLHNFSTRPFPEKIQDYEYDSDMRIMKVTQNGSIRWKTYYWIYLTASLKGKYVGVLDMENGI